MKEIDLSGHAELLEGSSEILRMWRNPDGPATCVINLDSMEPDPFPFGLFMVDAVRHAAKAYARVVNVTEEQALTRISEGVDAERDHYTTGIVSLSDKEGMH